MSVESTPDIRAIRAIRARLRNPPNGHPSNERSEIKVGVALRKTRIEHSERQRAASYLSRIDTQLIDYADKIKLSTEINSTYNYEPALVLNIPKIRDIVEICCDYFGISLMDIISHRRSADLVLYRHIAIYLARELTPASFPQIGRVFNGRDHTTCLHAWRRAKARSADPVIFGHVTILKERIAAKCNKNAT